MVLSSTTVKINEQHNIDEVHIAKSWTSAYLSQTKCDVDSEVDH